MAVKKYEAMSEYEMARGAIAAGYQGAEIGKATDKLHQAACADILAAAKLGGPVCVHYEFERGDQACGSLHARTGLQLTLHVDDMRKLKEAFNKFYFDGSHSNVEALLDAGKFLLDLPDKGYSSSQKTVTPISDNEYATELKSRSQPKLNPPSYLAGQRRLEP